MGPPISVLNRVGSSGLLGDCTQLGALFWRIAVGWVRLRSFQQGLFWHRVVVNTIGRLQLRHDNRNYRGLHGEQAERTACTGVELGKYDQLPV